YKFYTRLPWAEPKKQFPIRGKSLWVGAAEFRLRPARWRGRATAAFEITGQWRYAAAAIRLLNDGGGGVTSKTSTIVAEGPPPQAQQNPHRYHHTPTKPA